MPSSAGQNPGENTPSGRDLPRRFPSLHEAPSACARLALALQKSLEELGVRRGERLLLAVSGGADSVALASLCALLRERFPLKLGMLACDHGLRPESAAEVRFVQALGELLDIPCETCALTIPKDGAGIEERARKARYRALEDARRRAKARYMVLAHHAKDLAEDIVMRLMRGTGWPGLGGMAQKDEERHILRPLLFVEPGELRDFLQELGIPHCEDPSNLDTRYLRNRIRHTILPLLERENPGLLKSLQGLALLAREDAAFFEEQLGPVLALCRMEESCGTVTLALPEKVVKGLAPSLSLRLFLELLRRMNREGGVAGQARSGTLFGIAQALRKAQRPRTFQLPGGISLTLTGKEIILQGKKSGQGTRKTASA